MPAPQLNDNETYGWAYAPPSHLEGEPAVPIPDEPPGLEIPANRATRLPSGVVAYRETVGHHNRMQQLDQQAQAAKMARDQAAQDAKMLDMMMRVAKSTKDIVEAQRFIALRRLEQDIGSGMAPHQAFVRNPMALGSGLGTALRATTPDAAPTKLEMPGMPPAVMANGRPYWPPASAMPDEPLSTTAVPITDPAGNILGHRAATGPRTGTIVQRASSPGSITQEKRLVVDALRGQLRDVEKAIADNTLLSATPAVKAKIDEWTGQRDELKRKLAELVPGGYSIAPPKSVSVLGQGTRSDPARPTTKEQFNSLPSGAFFINPSDGKLRQKK